MRWTRWYTSGLSEDVREVRRAEIASDVFEELAAAGTESTASAASAASRAVVWRTIRGMADDVTWRLRERRKMHATGTAPSAWRSAWRTMTQAWFTPIAALVGAFNVLFGLGILANVGDDARLPGRVIGPTLLFAFGASIFVGLRMLESSRVERSSVLPDTQAPHLADAPSAGARRHAVALTVIAGLALVALGWGGGAGLPPVIAVAALAVAIGVYTLFSRRYRARSVSTRRARTIAEVLLVLGTLPSLALFWTVVPPILAIAVIAGVLGVGPSRRRHAAA